MPSCQDQGGSAQETGRPEAPDEMDKVECREGPGVDDSQRPDGEALWSLYMHVLCLQSAEWELRPCMQTFPCTAPAIHRLLMRFSGEPLKDIKTQYLQDQY